MWVDTMILEQSTEVLRREEMGGATPSNKDRTHHGKEAREHIRGSVIGHNQDPSERLNRITVLWVTEPDKTIQTNWRHWPPEVFQVRVLTPNPGDDGWGRHWPPLGEL